MTDQPPSEIRRVLIANRGEIAVRIIKACQELGIETVLAASEVDRASLPARLADRTVCIGPASATDSYLDHRLIVCAALGTNADAVHPGYGFLAESPDLAQACAENGLRFIGPRPDQIRRMGNKLEARLLAHKCGVPLLPGSERIQTVATAKEAATEIGFPILIKAAAGGGGRGMKVVAGPEDLEWAYRSATSEARAAFGDDSLYLEKFVPNARHIEVQVLGDGFGRIIHLGERDCSLQRRHQKIVEEAPAPDIAEDLRDRLRQAALTLARSIAYENAGTVEFIVDRDSNALYFLEMNTRIQVEHPVTEMVTGIDIVQEQFRIARGESLRFAQQDIVFRGHAIECRVNAECPDQEFRPDPGRIVEWIPPDWLNVRVHTHCFPGYEVPPHYDSMLAKLVAYGSDRPEAILRMRRALGRFKVAGIHTTIPFLQLLMNSEAFGAGDVNTRFVEDWHTRASQNSATDQ